MALSCALPIRSRRREGAVVVVGAIGWSGDECGYRFLGPNERSPALFLDGNKTLTRRCERLGCA
jgi:hypothetical protein